MNYVMENLISTMEEKNVSAKTLCAALDIPASTFSTWKSKDREPKPSQIAKAARFLGVTTDQILMGDKTESGRRKEKK